MRSTLLMRIFLGFGVIVGAACAEDGVSVGSLDGATSSLRKGTPGAVNGQSDYCDNPANPCVSGEGDCDTNAQCTGAGIVCGSRNGTRFGQWWSNDVCWPATCQNGVLDPGEIEIDNGGPCGCWLRTYYFDSDRDGYGRATTNVYCDGTAPSNWSLLPGDCADTIASINPGAAEICGDNIDQNCNGVADDGCATTTWCVDNDGDGFARSTNCVTSVSRPGFNWLANPTVFDCLDTNPSVFPGATETCNGLDDDCDGTSDEGVTSTWYLDNDNDGFPRNTTQQACSAPAYNWRLDGTFAQFDCSATADNNASVYPGAPELCTDTLDNDCDGLVNEECPPEECFNGVQDGNETGVDCGGFCDVCSPGPTATSCTSLPDTCGPSGNTSCCEASTVFGADYIRSYDGVGLTDASGTATVYSYRLDQFEVTVGRFKEFLADYDAWRASAQPASGVGEHPLIAGTGWNSAWDAQLAADAATFATNLGGCSPYIATYTASSANDDLPITCPTWFEAFAFCVWDGGRLPTEAEWNLAAAGGDEQRVYPWSSPATSTTIDWSRAAYWCNLDSDGGTCALSDIAQAGELADGRGRWGHYDLAGNAWEWTWDFFASPYTTPCVNCANTTQATFKVIRGGGYTSGPDNLRAGVRQIYAPVNRSGNVGFRCARGG